MRRTFTTIGVLTVLLRFAIPAHAGLCNAPPEHDVQLLAGYSPASSAWIGKTADRRFVLGGIEYGYRCWNIRLVDISYTAGLLPAAILLQPTLPNQRSLTPRVIPAHAVYGLGVLPVGFTARFGRHHAQPFFATHGGIIASTEPIPINAPDATGLNFLFDFSPGVRFKFGNRSAISVGYKFLHISNAYTTNFNPGVDNNIVFAGFSIVR
jgi:hypothetical protein